MQTLNELRAGYPESRSRKPIPNDSDYNKATLSRLVNSLSETETGCWEWQKHCNKFGYGTIRIRTRHELTHVTAYRLLVGPSGKLHVLHSCDNPRCCNPSHLWIGTKADNNRDRKLKGRNGDHNGEKNGRAKLTPSQVVRIREKYATGSVTQKDLAQQFNVTQTQICSIVRRKRWVNI